MRRGVGAFVVAVVVALAGGGAAAVLPPQTIDAGTGADAIDVGAAFGGGQGWAGFLQKANGVVRFSVAHAEAGHFGPPVLADDPALAGTSGATGAALAGNAAGDAVAVSSAKDAGGHSVLFARRLAAGQVGALMSVTAPGDSGYLPQPALGVHHRRVLAENADGAAALCYLDQLAAGHAYVAVLASGATTWTRYGPLLSVECDDIGVDSRGNVLVVGLDAGNHPAADRVVNGTLHSEEVDVHGMDEPSLALAANGAALVFARTSSGGDFSGSAWRMRDIAAGGAWEQLGTVDSGVRLSGQNTEYVRAALNADGKGILTFRVNNPAAGTSALYVAPVDAAAASPVGAAQKLADVDVGSDAVPQVDAAGNGYVLHDAAANSHPRPTVNGIGAAHVPRNGVTLESIDATATLCLPCFQVDAAGDFLALARRGAAPQRIDAVFDDDVPPTLAPSADSARVVLGKRATLHAHAADTFAPLAPSSILWHFPAGSVAGPTTASGEDVSATFLVPGAVRVTVTGTDSADNVSTAALRVRVVAHPRLRVEPSVVSAGGHVVLVGGGFRPATRVALLLGPQGSDVRRPFATTRAGRRGGFRVRVPIALRQQRRLYGVLACQLACRIEARAAFRVR